MRARQHEELATELAEWWEDLWQCHTGSRVVLLKVPSGWGRTTVLDRLEAETSGGEDAPVTLMLRINGRDLPDGVGLQAQALRTRLARVLHPRPGETFRAVELLGLDEPGGQIQLGLGIGGLLFTGLTAGISFLLAGLVAGAAQKAWDASPAGQDGALARTARAAAAVSAAVPFVVVIDDADCLNTGLAVTMAENLTARTDSQVLLIAAVDPGGALARALATEVRSGFTGGLVHAAEADPDMGFESRLNLARGLRPGLQDSAARRIAQRTTTFAEVFTVVAAPRLADLGSDASQAQMIAIADAVIDARLVRPAPSPEAAVISWAGGLAHTRQVDRALEILGTAVFEGDPDVRRWEALERLADPAAPRLAQQVTASLTAADRQALADAFLREALTLAQDPAAGLIERVAALRAAHHVRRDLPTRDRLVRAQVELVTALEALGDIATALQVATEALAGWPGGAAGDWNDKAALAAAVLRLSYTASPAHPEPLVQQLIAEAVAGGAVAGIEARIWAAIILLDTPSQREAALAMTDRAAADLDTHADIGVAGDQWRLLLAYHAGRAGLPDLTTRLIAPLTTSPNSGRQDAAAVVLRAVDGPGADIRLQNILLESDLAAMPASAEDDRLRLHHALAANHAVLGDYHRALAHGQQELGLRTHIQGPDHPGTLASRARLAFWTGASGDLTASLRLHQELLPDQERVLGTDHRSTLATRADIADRTGQCGELAAAVALHQELLRDMERVLGPHDPDTLTTRSHLARWTSKCGHPAAALALDLELLPDMERVLGPDDPATLGTRYNMAECAGECGQPAAALALYQKLLPDHERVLGSRHPQTLMTRSVIAHWTGRCGDSAAALTMELDLLPERERILGPDHPDTLASRNSIATWTGENGDPAAALALYQGLLSDVERVLGPQHPDTLATHNNIADWTERCGDAARALVLYRNLLPDVEQVFGAHHPNTMATRRTIARLTMEQQSHR